MVEKIFLNCLASTQHNWGESVKVRGNLEHPLPGLSERLQMDFIQHPESSGYECALVIADGHKVSL